jgi:hypothetical protein
MPLFNYDKMPSFLRAFLDKKFRADTKSKDDQSMLAEVTLWNFFLLLISGLTGYTVGFLGGHDAIPKGLEIILPIIITGLLTQVVPSPLITARLSAKYQEGREDEKNERRDEIRRLEKMYRSSIVDDGMAQHAGHLYYLARLASNEGEVKRDLGKLVLAEINTQIQTEIERLGLTRYEENLIENSSAIKQIKIMRCEVHGISSDTFKSIALIASMTALGLRKSQKLEMDSGTSYHTFFLDIYSYLQAWLVCSIDNDTKVSMPKGTIGLNYPNRDKPRFDLYIKAFECVQRGLRTNKSLLHPNTSAALTQTITERIDELIEWVKYQQNS